MKNDVESVIKCGYKMFWCFFIVGNFVFEIFGLYLCIVVYDYFYNCLLWIIVFDYYVLKEFDFSFI